MNKLQMAQEYALKMLENLNPMQIDKPTRDGIAYECFELAEAMLAENDKRVVKLPDVFFDTKQNEEWQPDWSQAPDNMTHFAVDANGSGWFFNREPHAESDCCWYCGDDSIELDNHNYQGNWQDSLRKRPQ